MLALSKTRTLAPEPVFFFFLAALSISSSAYVGLNGGYVWRQADVYAQILGFMRLRAFAPFQDFLGHTVLYDMPVYQWLVARVAELACADALVATRYLNLGLWALMMWSGGRIASTLRPGAAVYFWALVTTSPLLLHYFATPMPDVMAATCAMTGIVLLVGVDRRHSWWMTGGAASLLALAALIKSPIPFVFIIFHGCLRVLQVPAWSCRLSRLQEALVLGSALLAALSAEAIRKLFLNSDVQGFAQDPLWYFGTLALRQSAEFWRTLLERLQGTTALEFLANLLLGLMLLSACLPRGKVWKIQLAAAMAFLSGWLVFSNVYVRHDYYQIPVALVFLLAASVALAELTERVRQAWAAHPALASGRLVPAILTTLFFAAIPVLMVFGNKISDYRTESVFDSATFALRETDFFLWVHDYDSGPIMGGLTKTQFRRITLEDFETHCQHYLDTQKAILVSGRSACLSRNKQMATTYIDDAGLQIYVNNLFGAKF